MRLETEDAEIHAFLSEPQRRKRVLAESRELLARFPDPAFRPPLFGIPIGVKDLFRVDGLPTQAGSNIPPEAFHGPQATIVNTLRQKGAIVLGKTVSTEFAYFSPGPTRNPLNPAHTPGGSSSGSAAAVAKGLCPLALGTQTIASVNRPAAYCGIWGFKPSFGRIPMEGVFPFSQSVDHVGYFTSHLDDLAYVATCILPAWNPQTKTSALRMLIPRGDFILQADAASNESFNRCLDVLAKRGAELIEADIFPDIDQINDQHKHLIAAEFALNHRTLFARYAQLYTKTSVELIELGKRVSPSELATLRKLPMKLRDRIQTQMRKLSADLILSPGATGTAPIGLASTGSPLMSLPFTQAGLPSVSLPYWVSVRTSLPVLSTPQGEAFSAAENALPYALALSSAHNKDEYLLWAVQKVSQLLES